MSTSTTFVMPDGITQLVIADSNPCLASFVAVATSDNTGLQLLTMGT